MVLHLKEDDIPEDKEKPEFDTIAWQIERFAAEVEQAMSGIPYGAQDDEGRYVAPELHRIVSLLRQARQNIANRQYDDDFEQPKFLLAAMKVYYRHLCAQARVRED